MDDRVKKMQEVFEDRSDFNPEEAKKALDKADALIEKYESKEAEERHGLVMCPHCDKPVTKTSVGFGMDCEDDCERKALEQMEETHKRIYEHGPSPEDRKKQFRRLEEGLNSMSEEAKKKLADAGGAYISGRLSEEPHPLQLSELLKPNCPSCGSDPDIDCICKGQNG